jgi:hypothetical protein
MNSRALRLSRLAAERVLNAGPDACERMEQQALAAIKKAEWPRARRLLRLRLQMQHRPDAAEVAAIERLLRLIDEAEAKGIGPDPALTLTPRERTSLSCPREPSPT